MIVAAEHHDLGEDPRFAKIVDTMLARMYVLELQFSTCSTSASYATHLLTYLRLASASCTCMLPIPRDRREELQPFVYDPDRGKPEVEAACAKLKENGGFWSPWKDKNEPQ
jgi:hypothetical protein